MFNRTIELKLAKAPRLITDLAVDSARESKVDYEKLSHQIMQDIVIGIILVTAAKISMETLGQIAVNRFSE